MAAKKKTKKAAKRTTKRPAKKSAKKAVKKSAPKKLVSRITSVLLVEAIEPCLPFWQAIGFEKTVEVPEGNRLGFVILVKDGAEVMYQTVESVRNDIPALTNLPLGGTFLFIEVSDLDSVILKLGRAPLVFPRRKTFYGMDEIGFREPGGHSVTFASPT